MLVYGRWPLAIIRGKPATVNVTFDNPGPGGRTARVALGHYDPGSGAFTSKHGMSWDFDLDCDGNTPQSWDLTIDVPADAAPGLYAAKAWVWAGHTPIGESGVVFNVPVQDYSPPTTTPPVEPVPDPVTPAPPTPGPTPGPAPVAGLPPWVLPAGVLVVLALVLVLKGK